MLISTTYVLLAVFDGRPFNFWVFIAVWTWEFVMTGRLIQCYGTEPQALGFEELE
jgi:hypothetical protein